MLPIGTIFSRLPRVVHDLCRKLGKEADLELVGEETELDKNMIEALTDPLIHLVRNCIDHGIEMPEERLKAGKPGRGAITIRAAHEGGGIVIEIKDDGKGLDRQKLLAKAQEKGLLPSEKADEELSDEQVYGLIMLPGFSTAGAVTEISGRGVGMDVVKRNVEQLGGRIQIQSTPGQGTIFTLRLPLTLAIIDGMLISVGEEVYVVPLTTILESRKPNPSDLKTVASRGRMLKVREEYLPVIDLAELFNIEAKTKDESESIVVIVDAQGQKAALIVDDLLGQTQVVVKSLSQNFKKIAGFAGATILGNGKVTLILDCAGLLNMQQHITEV
jgi:two-component system chemotaxis sensor kinase CheA